MAFTQLHAPRQGGVLLGLGRVQRLVGPLIDRRGIAQGRVQPFGVEGVAQIVVGVDVAARPGFAVAVQEVADPVEQPHRRMSLDVPLQPVQVQRQHLEQGVQVRGVPFPGHVAFGEADGRSGQHAAQCPIVADQEHALWTRLRTVQRQALA